ncbi:MAG: alpha/beta hydrolase [marine benthic group bacterium]|nr:alpha/beta hydrolase [Candidatus Carthagonibacter metallireducens]
MSDSGVIRRLDSSSPGVLLGVREAGEASSPPLLFLHGFPLHGAMWAPQVAAFSSEWRTIAPDARGAGASDVGTGQYTMELLVDDLFAVLDQVAHDEPVVAVGLSMGGYILLRALEREPQRFRGVVLCDTRSAADGRTGKLARAIGIRRIEQEGLEPFVDDFLEAVLAPGTRAKRPESWSGLKRMMMENSPIGVRGQLLAMASRVDTGRVLGSISQPSLVVNGSEDRLTRPAAGKAMAAKIPNAVFSMVEGAGHLSSVEAPAEFNRILGRYLQHIR